MTHPPLPLSHHHTHTCDVPTPSLLFPILSRVTLHLYTHTFLWTIEYRFYRIVGSYQPVHVIVLPFFFLDPLQFLIKPYYIGVKYQRKEKKRQQPTYIKRRQVSNEARDRTKRPYSTFRNVSLFKDDKHRFVISPTVIRSKWIQQIGFTIIY